MIADFSGRPPIFGGSSNAFFALAGRARRTSNAALVTAEIIGFAGAVAVPAFAPHRWELALPAVSVGAFGLWGITDHVISQVNRRTHRTFRSLLSAFRYAIAAAGIAAAIGFGYIVIGLMMGVFIL